MKKNQSAVSLNNASWSHQYGISKENNGSHLFGLNPNLNIEDQYIQNMLKQIHFMTMQIKLLKEKQAQSQGNSMWTIINRANQPLVKNIVDSNEKYQSMKKNVDSNVNKTQYENIKLADQQSSFLKKMHHLEKRITIIGNSKQENDKKVLDRKQKVSTKIADLQQKLKKLTAEKNEQTKRNSQLIAQSEDLLNVIEKQKFINAADAKKIKNDEDIEIQIEAALKKEIQSFKMKIKTLESAFQMNVQFKKAKQNEQSIKENMKRVTTCIANYEFQVLKLTQSIKLAQKEKDKEIIQRKKLMEQYEALKVILKEIQTLNQARINQEINIKKKQSMDIQKGQTQGKKLEKNLQEIKRKLNRTEESQKILRQQVQHLQRQLLKLKNKKEKLQESLTKLTSANDKQDTQFTTFSNEFKRVQDQYQKANASECCSVTQLNEIEAQIMFLRQRKQYLTQTLNLKQTLNQTKLQDLQKVVVKNKDVNQTVDLLMRKWQEIKQFSKI